MGFHTFREKYQQVNLDYDMIAWLPLICSVRGTTSLKVLDRFFISVVDKSACLK